MSIEHEAKAYYIGKHGDNVRRIEQVTGTKIHVEEDHIRVRGTENHQINNAETEINKVTESLKAQRIKNKKIPCRYIAEKGYCREVDKCRFSHDQGQSEKTYRSRAYRSRSRSPYQKQEIEIFNEERAERIFLKQRHQRLARE